MAIYGVTFDGVSSAGTRTDNAVGMGWERSTNEIAGQDDFASVAPFNVRECVTKYNSGTGQRDVLGYKGDAGYDALRADTTNDIMIEFPCFWYQRPSKYVWRVSDSPVDGFKPAPMFYHKGKLYKTMRVSKYNPNNNFVSQTGMSPRVSTNMDTFRTSLRAKGQYMIDYPTWCSITMLSLVKYANMDVQNTVGQGVSSGSVVASGGTDSVLGLDGSAGAVSTTPLSVVTHGIENLYGNTWKYVDGFFSRSTFFYYKDVLDMVADPISVSELEQDYIKINTQCPSPTTQSALISDIAFDNLYDFGLFPTETGSPSPSGDGYYWASYDIRLIVLGDCVRGGAYCGLFAVCNDTFTGYSTSDFSSLSIEFGEQYPQKQLYITSDNKVYAMMV